MKKLISILLMATLSVSLMACGNKTTVENETVPEITEEESVKEETLVIGTESQTAESTDETESATETDRTATVESVEEAAEKNILVVYFSATGNTRAIAENIADGLQADLYEIVPKEPYTDADLNYSDNNSRSTLEMNNASARPEISGAIDHFEQYDTVFLGYPIWWGEAPRILDTFVESYDFTGKTVIPFCTSASSGIGSTADTLKSLAGSGTWLDGQRFRGNESADSVLEWAAAQK